MHEVISKHIAQFRYIPTLAFYDGMFNIASTLEGAGDFKDWRARRDPDAALLFDKKARAGLNVDSRSITYTAENVETSKDRSPVSSRLIKYSTLFLDTNNVTNFNHVGMRRIGIFETKLDYEAYVERFVKAFLRTGVGLDALVADKVSDTLYVMEGVKDGFTTRLRLAPLKQDQFESHYSPEEFTPPDLSLKKTANILIDLDVFSQTESDNETAVANLLLIEEMLRDTYAELIEMIKTETLR